MPKKVAKKKTRVYVTGDHARGPEGVLKTLRASAEDWDDWKSEAALDSRPLESWMRVALRYYSALCKERRKQ